MTTLKHKTVKAIKWSYFSMAAGVILQLVLAALLARLLTPADFKVVALLVPLHWLGLFIADLGMGQALVQKAELTEDDVQAAFTSSVGLGLLIAVLAWFLAPLAGRYFYSPELVAVFRASAVSYVPLAVVVVSSGLLRRALNFRPIVIADLASYIFGHGLFGLGAAYLGYGAFSLGISAIAQAVIKMVILYASSRHSLRLTFRWAAYRPILAFGSRVTVVNFLEFISSSLDTFFLGRLYPAVALGLYNRAGSAVTGPAMNFAMSLTRVLAPSFSALQTERERLGRAYHSALMALTIVMSCLAGCLFIDAREIVLVMLGGKFLAAIGLVKIFALMVPFMVSSNLAGILTEATARLNAKIAIQTVYLVAIATAFWITYKQGGDIVSVALVLLGAVILRNVAFLVLARSIVGGGRAILKTYALGLVCALVSAGVSFAVVVPLRNLGVHTALLFVTELLLGLGLVTVAILAGPPNELQGMARRALQGASYRFRAAVGLS